MSIFWQHKHQSGSITITFSSSSVIHDLIQSLTFSNDLMCLPRGLLCIDRYKWWSEGLIFQGVFHRGWALSCSKIILSWRFRFLVFLFAMISLDALAAIDSNRRYCFPRFQQIAIDDDSLTPPNGQHYLKAVNILLSVFMLGLVLLNPHRFSFWVFIMNLFFSASTHTTQKTFPLLSLKKLRKSNIRRYRILAHMVLYFLVSSSFQWHWDVSRSLVNPPRMI